MTGAEKRAYWHSNLRLMVTLLSVWFVVSFLFGILLVDQLDRIRIGSLGLGFWFAQQGSIYTFVALIGIYAWRMDALDARFGARERNRASGPTEAPPPPGPTSDEASGGAN